MRSELLACAVILFAACTGELSSNGPSDSGTADASSVSSSDASSADATLRDVAATDDTRIPFDTAFDTTLMFDAALLDVATPDRSAPDVVLVTAPDVVIVTAPDVVMLPDVNPPPAPDATIVPIVTQDAAVDAAVTPDAPSAGPEMDAGRPGADSEVIVVDSGSVLDASSVESGVYDATPRRDVARDVPTMPIDAAGAFGIVWPWEGSVIRGTALVRVAIGPESIDDIQVSVTGMPFAGCSLVPLGGLTCPIDLSSMSDGATVEIVARSSLGGIEVASDSVTVVQGNYRSELCAGFETATIDSLADCVGAEATAGNAAGYAGIVYENRDDGASAVNTSRFPGITVVQNALGVEADDLPFHSSASTIIVGNSAYCHLLTPGDCMGGARAAMTYGTASTFERRYRANKLYWFPAFDDHAAADRAFFMVPFMNSAYGARYGADDEVRTWIMALAALQPATRSALVARGTTMAALQSLFRRSRVTTDSSYLSSAHQNAYDNASNRLEFLQMANALPPDAIPPTVSLSIASESSSLESGRVLTTPTAIVRAFPAGASSSVTMNVRAFAADPNGRPVHIVWRVLRGGPTGASVAALDDGSLAFITFTRSGPVSVSVDGRSVTSTVLAVAAFAHNGEYWSAPSIVSISDARP